MKIRKLLNLTAVCTVLGLALASCNTENDNSTNVYESVSIETYDASGNSIVQTFTEMPKRIICNNVSSAKTLIDLGLEEFIVGMPNPDNEVTDQYKDKINAIAKLGDKKTISKEIVLSSEPDIVIGRAQMFSASSFGTYSELNTYGIEIYTQATSVASATLDSVLLDIRNLGKIFKVEEKAENLISSLSSSLNEIPNASDSLRNALVMCNFDGSTFGAYKSILQEKALNRIGYTNIATGTSGLSIENLVSMNPELIIYITSDRNKKNDQTAIKSLMSNTALGNVTAIENNKIITLGYDVFMEYGSNIIDAIQVIYDSIK